ncbi:hypothetical protein [uncultured Fusobacterium sp.]|uniref:hypothetical protein n=1 Tax=uncultured Fusobacterium sp. TaxID=159267 RepID=UPI0025D25A88|nr:hypothetical protein [uncultured Fusobacterium sp.]
MVTKTLREIIPEYTQTFCGTFELIVGEHRTNHHAVRRIVAIGIYNQKPKIIFDDYDTDPNYGQPQVELTAKDNVPEITITPSKNDIEVRVQLKVYNSVTWNIRK